MGSYLLRMSGCCSHEKQNVDSTYSLAEHPEKDTSIDDSRKPLDVPTIHIELADDDDEQEPDFLPVKRIITPPRRPFTRRDSPHPLSKSVTCIYNKPRRIAPTFGSDNHMQKSVNLLKRKQFSLYNTSNILEEDRRHSTSAKHAHRLALNTQVSSCTSEVGHLETCYSSSRTENTSVDHDTASIVENSILLKNSSDNYKADVSENSHLSASRLDSSVISQISEDSSNMERDTDLVEVSRVSDTAPKDKNTNGWPGCSSLEEPETQHINDDPHKVAFDGEVKENKPTDEHEDEDTDAYNADDECSIHNKTYEKTNVYIDKQPDVDLFKPQSSGCHNILENEGNSPDYANNGITPGQIAYTPSEVKRTQRRRVSRKHKRTGNEQTTSDSDSSHEMNDCGASELPHNEQKRSKSAPSQ